MDNRGVYAMRGDDRKRERESRWHDRSTDRLHRDDQDGEGENRPRRCSRGRLCVLSFCDYDLAARSGLVVIVIQFATASAADFGNEKSL